MREKRHISLLLALCLMLTMLPVQVLADQIQNTTEATDATASISDPILEETNSLGELGGYLAGNALNIADLYADRKFTMNTGFGFAAENGNNFADRFKGLDASVVGDNNAANGPDRMIINRDGTVTWVQTKYHSTASRSVADAFDDAGNYRYVVDGKPMQLEVPADQFDDAVEFMRKRIENGQLENCGVTDPDEAKNIVRKGQLTFEQAILIP